MCNGIIKSGPRKGLCCNNRAVFSGYCRVHEAQIPVNNNYVTFVNQTDKLIVLEQMVIETDPLTLESNVIASQQITTIPSKNVWSLEIKDIKQYCIVYYDLSMEDGYIYNSIYYLSEIDELSINGRDTMIIIPTPIEEHKKILCEKWKSCCLKALTIPKQIKKLSSCDTVHELCDLTEYIELPENVSKRDYELAGAQYNPDDDFEPEDYDEEPVSWEQQFDDNELREYGGGYPTFL